MKNSLTLLCLIVIFGANCSGQQNIKALINSNLKSRYTNVEVVSMTPDSCPDMNHLFNMSLSLKVNASECKLNIAKATLSYYQKEISLDRAKELCDKELKKMDELAKVWQKMYFSNSEKCLLVKYRYGNASGLKTTVDDNYSLKESQYKEGNYPYLQKEFNAYYGLNLYKEVSKKYEDFLMEIVNS